MSSPRLVVQTKKYGAITTFDLMHEESLVASLIKEGTNLVDYSRRRIFQDWDSAIEFYLVQLDANQNSWILTIGLQPARNAFVLHHSSSSFAWS